MKTKAIGLDTGRLMGSIVAGSISLMAIAQMPAYSKAEPEKKPAPHPAAHAAPHPAPHPAQQRAAQEKAQQQHQQQAKQHEQQARQHEQQARQHEQQARQHQQQARQQQARQQQQAQERREESFKQEHPARAEVLGRDANLNNRLNQDKGDLTGHYGQLKSDDNSIRRQEQRDAAQNGGHLTRQEYKQLNREENGLSRQIGKDNYGAGDAQFQQNHPGRSEVMGRDANLNNRINEDKGDLNGHYGQLKSEDNSIRRQEQRDAAQNGGHLTGQEYKQLNREENGLSRQVGKDNYGAGDAQFQQNHPGRSEVMGRDANLNNQINQDKGQLGGNYGQLKSEDNSIRHQEQVDAARNGGHLTGQEYQHLNREETALSRQIGADHRLATLPPLHGKSVPGQQSFPAPVLNGQVSAGQAAQAQTAYQNAQNNQYAVPANQAPPNYQQMQNSQLGSYNNGYPTTIGGQPVNINSGNTYVNQVPPSSYPSWWNGGGAGSAGGVGGWGPGGGGWAPGPGWGWGNGWVVGQSIRAGLGWLFGGWPHYYGPRPQGFIYPPGFVPTPWMYNPMMNEWRQPGQPWAVAPPPLGYVGPITVQTVEPISVGPMPMNQPFMYNAFYYPRWGRWGYRNRMGYFVWVNPAQPAFGVVD